VNLNVGLPDLLQKRKKDNRIAKFCGLQSKPQIFNKKKFRKAKEGGAVT